MTYTLSTSYYERPLTTQPFSVHYMEKAPQKFYVGIDCAAATNIIRLLWEQRWLAQLTAQDTVIYSLADMMCLPRASNEQPAFQRNHALKSLHYITRQASCATIVYAQSELPELGTMCYLAGRWYQAALDHSQIITHLAECMAQISQWFDICLHTPSVAFVSNISEMSLRLPDRAETRQTFDSIQSLYAKQVFGATSSRQDIDIPGWQDGLLERLPALSLSTPDEQIVKAIMRYRPQDIGEESIAADLYYLAALLGLSPNTFNATPHYLGPLRAAIGQALVDFVHTLRLLEEETASEQHHLFIAQTRTTARTLVDQAAHSVRFRSNSTLQAA